jgi:ATP synthase protein I
MGGGIRGILISQTVLVIAVAAAWFGLRGAGAAQAALYGGGLAVLNGLMLARRVRRAGDVSVGNVTGGVGALYLGALQRFALVLAGFMVGMGMLKLQPLPQIVGFAVAQLGYLLPVRR